MAEGTPKAGMFGNHRKSSWEQTMNEIYKGNEFEAVKLRFENQTELLYRLTMIVTLKTRKESSD